MLNIQLLNQVIIESREEECRGNDKCSFCNTGSELNKSKEIAVTFDNILANLADSGDLTSRKALKAGIITGFELAKRYYGAKKEIEELEKIAK